MSGKLIVIDGTDGSGKATHTEMLLKRFHDQARECFTMSFPTYGKESCKGVEEYLNGNFGTAEEVGPYFASMLYAYNRMREAEPIRVALKANKIVILNRYVSSNMGHQAGKISDLTERERFLQWNRELEFEIFKLPKPDVTIFVHMPPEIGQKFVTEKKDRGYTEKTLDIHENDMQHLKNAEAAYIECAQSYGWKIVECAIEGAPEDAPPEQRVRTLEEINSDIYDIILPFLS